MHSINSPFQFTLSTPLNPFSTPSQHPLNTLSTPTDHPFSTPCSHPFSTPSKPPVAQVLASLSESLGRESARESSVWLNVLKEKDKAIVWVNNDGLTGGTAAGGRFVRANKVAFSCSLSHTSTEPHWSVVPAHGDFLKFRPLYVALGVREAFTVHDFAALTRELSNEYVDAVVPSHALGATRHTPSLLMCADTTHPLDLSHTL